MEIRNYNACVTRSSLGQWIKVGEEERQDGRGKRKGGGEGWGRGVLETP